MKFKTKIIFICLSLGTLFFGGCGSENISSYSYGQNGTIKIAVIGEEEYLHDNGSMEGAELAADDFYEKTGIKIETVIYDDEMDYNLAVERANEIVADGTISAVIVKQELDYIDTVAEIFEDAEMPFILAAGCYEHTIDNGYNYMIVDCINAKTAGSIMGDWVVEQGYKNVAFAHSDTEYEEDELKGFQACINGSETRLVDTLIGPFSQEDFDTAYARWKVLGVDAVCISNYYILNSDIVRMLRTAGDSLPVIGDYVMDSDDDIEENGAYLDGTIIVGMYINDFNENNSEITEKYYETYDMEMSEKAIQSYDITTWLGEGLTSGITESSQLIDYMKSEEGYRGISGTLVLDEKGCIIPNGNEILIFKDGGFTQTER
ncbi:MAG: ABC transporter substrate-binding protein [Clostridiales bacterium]|nr:ABC transporter substrate-binding protein [Clostridiales bacterium]